MPKYYYHYIKGEKRYLDVYHKVKRLYARSKKNNKVTWKSTNFFYCKTCDKAFHEKELSD